LVALKIGAPSTRTSTVLVVPYMPPGFTMLPMAKVRVYGVCATVATVCETPVAVLLDPVRSSHCFPLLAGKVIPPSTNVVLTTPTFPAAPTTFQWENDEPLANGTKAPRGATGFQGAEE
jgi:hypothetical protein